MNTSHLIEMYVIFPEDILIYVLIAWCLRCPLPQAHDVYRGVVRDLRILVLSLSVWVAVCLKSGK